jgi:hypothetical protein
VVTQAVAASVEVALDHLVMAADKVSLQFGFIFEVLTW